MSRRAKIRGVCAELRCQCSGYGFGVHYNRAPLRGTVTSTRQCSAGGTNLHLGSMHWRCLLRRLPIYGNSPHIFQNNRAVTRFVGAFLGKDIA